MEQLVMNWKNDGSEAKALSLPEGITVKNFPNLDHALEAWQDIARFLDEEGRTDTTGNYYHDNMEICDNYDDKLCFFVLVDGIPAASITVICDPVKKSGYIHMVACKPEFRGRGIGHILNDVALKVLKEEKMETAYLTTDDWRIPAIKTYLKAGFEPDLDSQPDFKERWQAIYDIIGK